MNKQMLLQITNPGVRQQKKLLIITISFFLLSFVSHSQILSKQDSINFKNDLEKLLKKYGLQTAGYQINIQSNSQIGGQTAFIINNNYYGDTLSAKNNFSYKIITEGKRKILICWPIKGLWTRPFVAMDSSQFRIEAYYHYDGFVSEVSGLYAFVDGKKCSLKASYSSVQASKGYPIRINLSDSNPNDFFIFGDLQDISKTYIYIKGEIVYMGSNK